MRIAFFLLLPCLALSQTPPGVPQPDKVIAEVDGKPLTWGELRDYLQSLAPQARDAALANRPQLVHQYALMKKLVKIADENKLESKSPYKEMLAGARSQVLTQSVIQDHWNSVPATQADVQRYFDAHRDKYTEVKLKAVYLSFSSSPGVGKNGKKYRTAAEAKAEAEQVRKQLVGGADFAAVARDHSDDEKSKAAGGDFGTFHRSDQLPDAIKNAVFALKKGEVSQPVEAKNGYYVFRAEETGTRKLTDVYGEVFDAVKEQGMKAWLDEMNGSVHVKQEDATFFAAGPGPKK